MKRGRDKFNKFRIIINFWIRFCYLFPRIVRLKLFEHYRMTNGNKGILIRFILLKTLAKKIGDNVSIFPNVFMFNIDELSIGNNVSIHPMCYIEAKGEIEIGDDVSIAHAVTILSVNHVFADTNLPIKEQGIEYHKTEIKSNVWVGAKSSILAGVTIGSGSIIATGAVVTKNVDENCIVGGVPAKLIKNR